MIAIGNSGNRALLAAVVARLGDPDPLVRGAAVWALSRLDWERFRAEVRVDPDPDVAEEWRHAAAEIAAREGLPNGAAERIC
jgi:epoxyqueuosine reductase